jgi:hypothetical protein
MIGAFRAWTLCGMRSVPPRGSGWVYQLPICDCRLPILDLRREEIRNRQLTIGNPETHPLPRGGTDLTPVPEFLWFENRKSSKAKRCRDRLAF